MARASVGKMGFNWLAVAGSAAVVVVIAALVVPVFSQAKLSARRTSPSDLAVGAYPSNASKAGTEGARGDLSIDGTPNAASPAKPEDLALAAKMFADDSSGWDSDYWKNDPSQNAEAISGAEPASVVMPETESFVSSRLVVKNASFGIEVNDVQEAMDKATHLTKAMGGFIESSNKNETEGKGRGYMTIRIPQDKFETTVEDLRGYGEVKSETSSGDDVTAQVADIDARIRTLKSEEESYREILRQARRISDILDIRERISQVRQEIESLTAQQATLRRLASLATINLEFREAKKTTDEPKPDDWFDETNTSAILMLKGIGKFFAQIGIYVFNLAPIWVPVAGLWWWIRKRAGLAGPIS